VYVIAEANNAAIIDTVDALFVLRDAGLAKPKAGGGWISIQRSDNE
jgi:hypothetical protein